MKILLWPHPDLKKVSAEVTADNLPSGEWLDELVAIMRKEDGVGIAAIQVGSLLRIFVIETPTHGLEIMVNPVITATYGERVKMMEGCLSAPGQSAVVMRYNELEVRYQKPEGVKALEFDSGPSYIVSRAEGLRAQAIQHELDHLDGKFFTEYLTPAVRSRILGNMLKIKRSGK